MHGGRRQRKGLRRQSRYVGMASLENGEGMRPTQRSILEKTIFTERKHGAFLSMCTMWASVYAMAYSINKFLSSYAIFFLWCGAVGEKKRWSGGSIGLLRY